MVYLLLCLPVILVHAVELSQSSSTSPVLTASEIAANVDNEMLNVYMEKFLLTKLRLSFPSSPENTRRSFPQNMNRVQKFLKLFMLYFLFVYLCNLSKFTLRFFVMFISFFY